MCPTKIVRRGALDAKLGADVAHRAVHPGSPITSKKFIEQRDCRLGQPYAMGLAVLCARPVKLEYRLSGHCPPTVDDVLTAHVRDLTGPLAGEQNQLETGVEFRPEPRKLGVREHTLAALGRVAIDQPTGICGDDLLLDRPGKDHGCCREHLIRKGRGAVETREDTRDIGALDRGSVKLTPDRQHVLVDQRGGPPPTAVMLARVFIAITYSQFLERPGAPFGHPLGLWVDVLRNPQHRLAGKPARIGEPNRAGVADGEPSWLAAEAIDELPRLRPRGLNGQGEAGLLLIPHN